MNPFEFLDYHCDDKGEDENDHESWFRIIDGFGDGVGCVGDDPAIQYEFVVSVWLRLFMVIKVMSTDQNIPQACNARDPFHSCPKVIFLTWSTAHI